MKVEYKSIRDSKIKPIFSAKPKGWKPSKKKIDYKPKITRAAQYMGSWKL